MAERVVDVLEPVQVEQDDGDAPAAVEGVRRPGEEQHAVGEPGEHVVRRLVGLAVDLEAQLLDETGALEVGAGVGHERLEEAEIVVVEAVELLVAVQGDDGSDGRVLVDDRGHDGVDVSPGDRVVAAPALRGRGRVEGRDAGLDGLGDDRRRVETDRLDLGGPMVVQRDPAGDARRLGEDQLGPARPHDGAHLTQHLEAHGGGLQVRGAQRPAEVVEALQRGEAKRQAGVAPVGRDEQGGDEKDRHRRPEVHPGGVEHDEREAHARRREHRMEQRAGDPFAARWSGRAARSMIRTITCMMIALTDRARRRLPPSPRG